MEEVLLKILTQFGLPTAALFALAWYHVSLVRAKDQEISRISDQRVKDKDESTQQLLGVFQEFTNNTADQTETMRALQVEIQQSRRR